MICKYCGTSMDFGESVCPKCKRAVTLENGNGFWDLMRGQNQTGETSHEAIDFKPDKRAADSTIRFFSQTLVLICCALCLFCFVLICVISVSHKHQINAIEKQFAQELEEQRKDLTEQIRILSDRQEKTEKNFVEELKKQRETLTEQLDILIDRQEKTERQHREELEEQGKILTEEKDLINDMQELENAQLPNTRKESTISSEEIRKSEVCADNADIITDAEKGESKGQSQPFYEGHSTEDATQNDQNTNFRG